MSGAVRRKLGACGGVTLFETLMAVAILALLSAVIMAGSGVAMSSSKKNTFTAECQTVSDTINTALSDPLRYATEIAVDDSGMVTAYTSPDYRIAGGRITVGTGAGSVSDAGLIYLDGGKLLLKGAAYSGLAVVPADFQRGDGISSDFRLTYSNAAHTFSGTYKLYDPVNQLLSDVCSFTFRSVNEAEAQSR